MTRALVLQEFTRVRGRKRSAHDPRFVTTFKFAREKKLVHARKAKISLESFPIHDDNTRLRLKVALSLHQCAVYAVHEDGTRLENLFGENLAFQQRTFKLLRNFVQFLRRYFFLLKS